MLRSDMKYLALLGLTIVLTLVWVGLQPEPVDWSQSYSSSDKRPFGSAILHQLHEVLFPGQLFESSPLPIYNTLPDSGWSGRNYIFITADFAPDEPDLKTLLDFAASGNTVFIAAQGFGNLADSLGFAVTNELLDLDSLTTNFVNPGLRRGEDFRFRGGAAAFRFAEFDTAGSVALGANSEGDANFIRRPFGDGAFFLNTIPLAFTNFNLLNGGNSEYACKALSYLPVQATIWDEYYKPGRLAATSPLRFVLNHNSLKWAWFVALTTLAAFILFEGKRRQRIIPVIEPPVNSTLDFVRTVGSLYFQNRDHKDLAGKKIAYFLEHLRSHFFVRTSEFDDAFYETVAEKSGAGLEQVRLLFSEIAYIRGKEKITNSDLLHLQQTIDKFTAKISFI